LFPRIWSASSSIPTFGTKITPGLLQNMYNSEQIPFAVILLHYVGKNIVNSYFLCWFIFINLQWSGGGGGTR
jgi:hypothetical protein